MFSALLAAAVAQPARVESHPVTEALAEIFVSACIKGEARLSRDAATRISWSELPRHMKKRFEGEKHGQFFKIVKPSPAYLVVANYVAPTSEGAIMICELANEGVDLATAWSKIASSATGKPHGAFRSGAIHYRLTFPKQRARVFLAKRTMSATIYAEAAVPKLMEECGPAGMLWGC